MPESSKGKFINRELSWLAFNERVLQEADDESVPLLERIKFLGIFSSNRDEFFRVRVASLRRMAELGSKGAGLYGGSPQRILSLIQERVVEQRQRFDNIFDKVLTLLEAENVHMVNERQLTADQGAFVRTYFHDIIRPSLVPIMLDAAPGFPDLRDELIYLAIKLSVAAKPGEFTYAIMELPTISHSRFLVLPPQGESQYIILIDDVIRFCLDEVFAIFIYDHYQAYTIKMTRDAELEIDDDVTEGMLQKMSKSLKQRRKGKPVRFIYDEQMPKEMREHLMRSAGIRKADNIIAGGRYHNFKDFIRFPKVGPPHLTYKIRPSMAHRDIHSYSPLFKLIREKDLLLHYPYHSFDHFIDFLREAAIDPKVVTIRMTMYRLAQNSKIINALVNAIRNGKQVTAVVELRARFDEEANIQWATTLRDEGAKVIYGVTGLKVHAKLLHVTRKDRRKLIQYAHIGTGNFNEATASLYSDHSLFTANQEIAGDVGAVFDFFENNLRIPQPKHLMISPFTMRTSFEALVEAEMRIARRGQPASLQLKMNSLVDEKMINLLYAASKAGVQIDLVIRGVCSLRPGVEGLSENIRAFSIVDRYLEHSRIFIFGNNGDPKIYISSGDWMTRNLDYRVEIAVPIVDASLKKELLDYMEIQLNDNVKARILDAEQHNHYRRDSRDAKIRSQVEMYAYLPDPGGWENGRGAQIGLGK